MYLFKCYICEASSPPNCDIIKVNVVTAGHFKVESRICDGMIFLSSRLLLFQAY
jgi:hypothetical protein